MFLRPFFSLLFFVHTPFEREEEEEGKGTAHSYIAQSLPIYSTHAFNPFFHLFTFPRIFIFFFLQRVKVLSRQRTANAIVSNSQGQNNNPNSSSSSGSGGGNSNSNNRNPVAMGKAFLARAAR